MALRASLARLRAGTHCVALPALLVDHDLGAERLISNILRHGLMACRADVGLLHALFCRRVAGTAVDPRSTEIVRVGGLQRPGVDLMMTAGTFDSEITDVLLVREFHVTD